MGRRQDLPFTIVSIFYQFHLAQIYVFMLEQLEWYNTYNQRIRDEIGSRSELSAEGKEWMTSKTNPIKYTFKLDQVLSNGQMLAPSMAAILVMLFSVLHSIL